MYNLKYIFFLLGLILIGCSTPSIKLHNPLNIPLADPYVLLASDGKYYMYGTGGVENGFKAYSSSDLVNWSDEGEIYSRNSDSSWCVKNFWAPEVYEKNNQFYLLYSADWIQNPTNELETFRIGIAVSDSPLGPFIEMFNHPFFDPGYPIIDANLLFAESGKVFLYYSRCCYKHPVESEIATWAKETNLFEEIEESWVYGIEIKPDFSGVIGEPALLLRPPVTIADEQSEWESRSVTSGEINRRWTEGSFIFKHMETYYMMYSANFYAGEHYAVGYATSKSPLGPFTKANHNPVLEKNTSKGGKVTGTGHNSVVFSSDGIPEYCVYHGRTKNTGNERVVFIDKMEIDKNGKLIVHGGAAGVFAKGCFLVAFQ